MADDALAAEILAMADEDQRFRRERSTNAPWDPSVDERNTRRMREIVSAIGWPTLSKVGTEAEHAAWLLVQHAELDFQKRRPHPGAGGPAAAVRHAATEAW